MDIKYPQKRGHQWWVTTTVPRTLTDLLGAHLHQSHEVGRLIYTVYSQGRGEKGLREVARGFKSMVKL